MCFTSPELRFASSYGHFTAAKEFRSQCHIVRFWNNQSRRVTIIHGFNAVEFACGPGKRAQKYHGFGQATLIHEFGVVGVENYTGKIVHN